MVNRVVAGDMGGGAFGLRSSLPGYDVLNEPFGSPNINFDTRLTSIGTVIKSGLIKCGGDAVTFPTMPYVPIVSIAAWDKTDLRTEQTVFSSDLGHAWLPSVAIVTNSSIKVVAYITPFYTTTDYYNPNGSDFLYYIFAAG